MKTEDTSIELQNEPQPSEIVKNGVLAEEETPGGPHSPSAPPLSEADSSILDGAGEAPAEVATPSENDLAAARALLRSARPGTSRRRPMSALRTSVEGLGEEPTVRPTTARALASVIVDAPVKEGEEEDDTFVQVRHLSFISYSK